MMRMTNALPDANAFPNASALAGEPARLVDPACLRVIDGAIVIAGGVGARRSCEGGPPEDPRP